MDEPSAAPSGQTADDELPRVALRRAHARLRFTRGYSPPLLRSEDGAYDITLPEIMTPFLGVPDAELYIAAPALDPIIM